MKTQNYNNHARYYPLHHFIVTPLTLLFFGWTVEKTSFETDESTSESIYFLILALIIVILPLLIRIYALKNQNRIIRSEMRLRYFHLTGKSFEEKENQLRSDQIIALRFAGDDELEDLIKLAINKNLSNKEIKLNVKNWKSDFSRV